MSESAGRLPSVSSVSSISLVEIKAETHLVLKAFLERTLSTPQKERPGNVGGSYNDQNKYSFKPQSKPQDGLDSQAEDEDEKKRSFKGLIKQLPHRSTTRRQPKDGSLGKESKAKQPQHTEDGKSSSSSSDEGDSEKKRKQKHKKIRKRLSMFFRLKEKQKKEKEKDPNEPPPVRPSDLAVDKKKNAAVDIPSPSHSPKFYSEVAEKLEEIVKSTKIKRQIPEANPSPALSDKDSVIQKLVQLLASEGDSINTRIQSDPFLRSSLSRLSYTSFARVLDIFGSNQANEIPAVPPASPTLQRMAVTMEVSRRIVMATGTQHMQGYAEHYMENFAPWVKSHGGWENVVDLEDHVECD